MTANNLSFEIKTLREQAPGDTDFAGGDVLPDGATRNKFTSINDGRQEVHLEPQFAGQFRQSIGVAGLPASEPEILADHDCFTVQGSNDDLFNKLARAHRRDVSSEREYEYSVRPRLFQSP